MAAIGRRARRGGMAERSGPAEPQPSPIRFDVVAEVLHTATAPVDATSVVPFRSGKPRIWSVELEARDVLSASDAPASHRFASPDRAAG